jgi:hypothetical protein
MSAPSTSGPARSSGEGEREIGPPEEAYDADWVAAAARERDPGLPPDTARELAVYAWDHLREVGRPDAPEIARRLFADHRAAGATAANVVALAAVAYCAEYAVDLG